MLENVKNELKIHKHFPNYGVSPDGKIWSFKRGQWRVPFSNNTGYLKVQLRTQKVKSGYRNVFVHRLVAMLFCEYTKESGNCVNHKDGDVTNNHYKNLEWVTHSENSAHAHTNNLTTQKGYTHSFAKVTPEIAKKIKQLSKDGKSQRAIAKIVGLGNGTVNRVIHDDGTYYPIVD